MSFIVFRSSAGSGKTYTLVREYLRLILRDPEHFRHILAITFTNKAAQEMKERLLKYLVALSVLDDSPSADMESMRAWLAEHGQLPPAEVPLKARKALGTILHQYNSLAVGTIDSFMHQVVRSFAHDMDIPAGFEVELDEALLCSMAVDNLLDRLGQEPELTEFIVDFIKAKVNDNDAPKIEKDLFQFSKLLLKEDARQVSGRLEAFSLGQFKELSRHIRSRRKAFEKDIQYLARNAMDAIKRNGFEAEDFSQGNRGIHGWFKKISEGEYWNQPNSYVNKTLEEGRWNSGKSKPSPPFEMLTRDLQEWANKIRAMYDGDKGRQYRDDFLVERHLHQLALIKQIWLDLKRVRDIHGKVPISEFTSLVHAKVMGESVPYIYERLGQRFHHFMIDEFQDTSILQWRSLLPLVENGLAEGYDSILVGDGKQAIYRWRNGEVEQFVALPRIFTRGDEDQLFHDREKTLVAHYRPESLDHNYRSCSHIVDFNNGLFDLVSDQLAGSLQAIYDGHRQQVFRKDQPGRVEIRYLPEEKSQAERTARALEQVLAIVEEEENRLGQLKGIAVLCRSNAHAREVSTYLLEHDKRVVSADAVQVGTAPTVRLVIACMYFLFNPDSRFNQVSLLEALHANPLTRDKLKIAHLFEGLDLHGDQISPILGREILLPHTHADWLKLPLVDLAETIIRYFGLQEMPDVYLQFMLDRVENYSRKQGNDINGFLNWWEETARQQSAVIPEGMDAIRVMTIHKAKGLQFPVVICPFINDNLKGPGKQGIWVSMDPQAYLGLPVSYLKLKKAWIDGSSWTRIYEEEYDRIMLDHYNTYYVAFTRPKDRLYILSQESNAATKPREEEDQRRSIASLLQEYVHGSEYFLQEENRWISGSYPEMPAEQGARARHAATEKPPFTLYSAEWRKRLTFKRQASESWIRHEDQKPVTYGDMVHEALARIKTIEDIPMIVQAMLLKDGRQTELLDNLNALLSHPSIVPFFAPGAQVKSEQAIIMPDGASYRPDKVLFTNDKTIVLDFKTGKPYPAHQVQVSEYVHVLHAMGYPNVSGLLAYLTGSPHIIEIASDVEG